MKQKRGLAGLMVTGLMAIAAHTALPTRALAHGAAVSLENFARKTQRVWIGVVPSHKRPARRHAAFELGGGKSMVVTASTPEKFDSGRLVDWQPNRILALVEGRAPRGSVRVSGHGDIGLYFLSPEDHRVLVQDAHAYVRPVPVEEETVPPVAPVGELDAHAPQFESAEAVRVSKDALVRSLRELSGMDMVTIDGEQVRVTERGSEAKRTFTHKLLVNHFKAHGLDAETKCYNKSWYKGCNVEATIWGEDRGKVVVLSSHLDSVTNPGVDDNGSGTAAIMEIARVLAARNPQISIRFLAFDQEELGLIGSAAYVRDLVASPREQVVGVFNMDMIGYDSDNDNAVHMMDCGRRDSVPLVRTVEHVNAEMGLGLKKVEACTNRSDHASFWSKDMPAVIVSENFFGNDGNRCYHRQCDTLDLINVPYMEKIVTLMANVAWTMAKPTN